MSNTLFRMKKTMKGYVNNVRMTKVFVFLLMVSIVTFVFWSWDATSNESHVQRPRMLVDTKGCRIKEVKADHHSEFYVREKDKCFKRKAKSPVVAGNDPLTPSLHLDANALSAYRENVKCGYSAVYRVDDFTSNVSANVTFLEDEDTPVKDEFVKVVCTLQGRLVFDNVVPFIQRKEDVEERCRKRKEATMTGVDDKLSVLFIIIDSVSRGHYLRHMKKTDRFLRGHVNMVDMQGFATVGKNTLPVMTPMLTGKSWKQWKNTLNLTSRSKVDALPLVWKEFAEQGYRVLYCEDKAYYGTFYYSVGGFATQPTDYYYRTLGLHYEKAKLWPPPCKRGRSEARMMLKWTRDFLTVFAGEPVFTLTFLCALSHDSLSTLHFYDGLVLDFFRHLDADNHLNRSMVFFMSDHGFRFGKVRSTLVGLVENYLPFLFIMFPRWFVSKFPTYAFNLKTNANRLVTAFDIHETLLDILHLADVDLKEEESKTSTSQVGLFTREVSPKRTCARALIPMKFCPCSVKYPLPLSSQMTQLLARKLVRAINNFTALNRSVCRPMRLLSVTHASMYSVDEEPQQLLYEIIVKVLPGWGIFEGTVLYSTMDNTFVVHQEEVQRINRYNRQGDCMEDGALKPFCYCRQQLIAKQLRSFRK